MTTEQCAKQADAPILTREACDILGCSVASITRWVATGYLPAVQVGRTGVQPHIFDRAVVEALAERRAAAKRALDWQHGAIA